MGTRGLWGIRFRGEVLAKYSHNDSFPRYLGRSVLKVIRNVSKERLINYFEGYFNFWRKRNSKEIPYLLESELGEGYESFDIPEGIKEVAKKAFSYYKHWYPSLESPDDLTIGEVLRLAEPIDFIENDLFLFENDIDFIVDSLFCEYAYIMNLDREVLEVYVGFNKDPKEAGPYASRKESREAEYYGSRLVTEIPFSEIRNEEREEVIKEIFEMIENNAVLLSLKGNPIDLDVEQMRKHANEVIQAFLEKEDKVKQRKLIEYLNTKDVKELMWNILVETKFGIIPRWGSGRREVEKINFVGTLSQIQPREYEKIATRLLNKRSIHFEEEKILSIHELLFHQLMEEKDFRKYKIYSDYEYLKSLIYKVNAAIQEVPYENYPRSKLIKPSNQSGLKSDLKSYILRKLILQNIKRDLLTTHKIKETERNKKVVKGQLHLFNKEENNEHTDMKELNINEINLQPLKEKVREKLVLLNILEYLIQNGILYVNYFIDNRKASIYLFKFSIFDFIT